MAGGSILFLIGTYVLIFWAMSWVMDKQRTSFNTFNPDFEALYTTTKGQVRARHKATGREFLFSESALYRHAQIATIATQPVADTTPFPEWLLLPNAKLQEGRKNEWRCDGIDKQQLLDDLVDVTASHGYSTEEPSGVNLARDLVTCNPKTLECLAISAKTEEKGGVRYEIWRSRVP